MGCCRWRPTDRPTPPTVSRGPRSREDPAPPAKTAQRCGREWPRANHGPPLHRRAWSAHRPAAPLSERTSARHRKTPSRPDWPVGPPTEPPRAARSLLAGSARQSERSPPLIGRLPLRPAAEAGTAASRRKGVRRAGECPRGRRGGRASGRGGTQGRGGARPRGSPMRWPTGELKGFPSRKSIAAAPRSADAAAAAHVTRVRPGRAPAGPRCDASGRRPGGAPGPVRPAPAPPVVAEARSDCPAPPARRARARLGRGGSSRGGAALLPARSPDPQEPRGSRYRERPPRSAAARAESPPPRPALKRAEPGGDGSLELDSPALQRACTGDTGWLAQLRPPPPSRGCSRPKKTGAC